MGRFRRWIKSYIDERRQKKKSFLDYDLIVPARVIRSCTVGEGYRNRNHICTHIELVYKLDVVNAFIVTLPKGSWCPSAHLNTHLKFTFYTFV